MPAATAGAAQTPAATAATAATTTPASQNLQEKERAALDRLDRLRQQADAAIARQDGAELAKVASAAEALKFADPANSGQRNLLAKGWREQAGRFRDALHRFLFVELKPLSETQRQRVLDLADAQGPAVLDQAGTALAQQEFNQGRKYLRATGELKSGGVDPATQLPIQRAGEPSHPWQQKLNEAFNAKMRELVMRQKA
jgi:hypothetical protein